MQDVRLRDRTWLCSAILTLGFSLVAHGQASRVAILRTSTTPKVVEDLIFAELSSRGFEIVARGNWLDEVADELELNLLRDRDRIERMKSFSRADVLLLLDTRINGDLWHTKVTLLETRYGTRLSQKLVVGGPDEFVWPIVAKVEEARRKFSAGMQNIVAVAPLESQNVTHEFDDLQSSLSHFLEEKFAAFPGTVVVEIERAQEILKEIALTGAIEQRVNVLLVGGEFEFREPDLKQVKVKLTFDDGHDVKEFSEVRNASDYQQWLSDTVIRYHTADGGYDGMGLRASRLGLSPDQQKKEFADLARSFRRLGDLDRSTKLIEAALVLDPSDEALRRQAAKDFLQLANRFTLFHRFTAQMPNAVALEVLRKEAGEDASVVEHLASRYMEHAEWLIRNDRLKSRLEFREFVRKCDGFPGVNSSEFEHRLARFVEMTATAWSDLPIEKASRARLDQMASQQIIDREEWWVTAPAMVLKHYWFTLDARFLETHRLLLELYPPQRLPHLDCVLSIPDRWQVHNFHVGPDGKHLMPHEVQLSRKQKIVEQMERVDHEAIERYVQLLQGSDNQIARLAGAIAEVRLASFLASLRAAKSENPKADMVLTDRQLQASERALKELVALKARVDELRTARKGVLPWDLRRGGYVSFEIVLGREFAKYDKEYGTDYASRIPDLKFTRAGTTRLSTQRKTRTKTWGRLKLEPLEVTVDTSTLPEKFRHRPVGDLDPIRSARNCGEFDVYWSDSVVYSMKKRGRLEALPIDEWWNKPQQIASVKWDGRFAWITGATKELYLLDSKSWRLHKVPSLPTRDWLKAEETGVGQAFLVGTLKPHYRSWIAKLTVTDASGGEPGDLRFDFRIFHQARNLNKSSTLGGVIRSNDFEDAFRCPWMSKVQLADGSEQVVVGRWAGKPIMIDPKTLKMAEFPIQVTPGYDNSDVIYSYKGTVLANRASKAALYREGVDVRKPEILPVIGCRRFAVHEKWIYAFGFNGTWDRIHRETYRVENLVPTMLPAGYGGCAVGNSAHYGLVGFGSRATGEEQSLLYTVSVLDRFRND